MWRSAFSTLGCAGRPLADVLVMAREGGWDGVELRAAHGEPVHVGLTARERRHVRGQFADAGVTPLAIASYVDVDDPAVTDDDVVTTLLAHAALARDLGAPYVRVFPGGPSDDGAAVRRLAAAAPLVRDVTLALETHDSCARGDEVGRVLSQVAQPNVRAVWDVQHPWRAGELVVETMRLLGPFLAYVQITDARALDDATPTLLGSGVLPLRDAYEALRATAYDGWISLEWAAYWFADAPPLEDALPTARRWLDGTLWD